MFNTILIIVPSTPFIVVAKVFLNFGPSFLKTILFSISKISEILIIHNAKILKKFSCVINP